VGSQAKPNAAPNALSSHTRVATYKGYTVSDLTCESGKGRWTARVAIMAAEPTGTRSQCFLDFETFRSGDEARKRAEAGAVAWIDRQVRAGQRATPSGFGSL
jgi:hypothetical protein